MKTLLPLSIVLFFSLSGYSQDGILPIIDMHLHCYDSENYWVAPDMYGTIAPENEDEHLK